MLCNIELERTEKLLVQVFSILRFCINLQKHNETKEHSMI